MSLGSILDGSALARPILLCALCPWSEPRDPNCSDLAVLTLHWMEAHTDRYVERHPEAAPYLCRGPAEPGPGNTLQLWPLHRVLTEISVGSGEWTWHDEFAWIDREHPARQADLEAEIARDGITTPILIGSDGRLWDGHHRVRAAARLGIAYLAVEITP